MSAAESTDIIGEPFACDERSALSILADVGPYLAVVNDPPWSSLAPDVPPPAKVIHAWDMENDHLAATADDLAASATAHPDLTVVGIGGGTALDTAKFIAWKTGLRLLQIPTITSVDAAFTDAVGVRMDGRVRYVGTIIPDLVVLDLELIASAPKRLNRAGIGDVLSCHTGLDDWRRAAASSAGPPWDESLARLGETLLRELEEHTPDIAAVTPRGLRFLANAYRRIGAACSAAGHSRFEEGSEHFWAYAYERETGAHHIHGELISFATVAIAHLQGNDPEFVHRVVSVASAVAHPTDLRIERSTFLNTVMTLRSYARAESLDTGIADLHDITMSEAEAAWEFASTLPRRDPQAAD